MSKYVVLTGASGLVGRYLVKDLLLAGKQLALVLRPSAKETVAERAEAILQFWEQRLGRHLPRPVVLEGDVAEPNLGLSPESAEWIAAHCDIMIHNAAILTFYGEDRAGEPWRTNLDGTAHTIEFCLKAGIKHFHYVSTAYVAGQRHDLCREDELDKGQGFRNDYEHSKFLAEQLVRNTKGFETITVYRPAVIAGDSQTGYTNTYHGIYAYLKLMSVLVWNTPPGPDGRRHTPIRLDITGDEPRNIVPVDWISACMARLFTTRAAWGGTYHLSPQHLMTAREVIEAGYKYFNSYGVEFGKAKVEHHERSDFEQAAYENKTMYQPYETTDPVFDTTNLKKFTADIPCPEIDEAMIQRFWKYGEEDRWGKRRHPRAKVEFYVAEQLAQRVSERCEDGERTTLGLNVTGPGGGQWTLELSGDVLCRVLPGLPEGDSPQVDLDRDEFAALLRGEALSPLGLISQQTSGAGEELAARVLKAVFSATPTVTRAS